MGDSGKMVPGDVISLTGAGPALNGTPEDLRRVEELYAADRENEALRIIDRILQLPAGVEGACERLRHLLTGSKGVEISAKVQWAAEKDVGCLIQPKLGGAFAKTLMVYRGKCFSAIMDRPSERGDEDLRRRALENAEILLKVFPGDSFCMTLAAQAIFHGGQRERAIDLLNGAIASDSGNGAAISTLRAFQASVGFGVLTESALGMISRFVDSGGKDGEALKKAVAMLNQSLDIFPSQAKAWAGLAWAAGIVGRRPEALEYLRGAQKIDPSESLTHDLAAEFSRLGWL